MKPNITSLAAILGASALLAACGGGDNTSAKEKKIEEYAAKHGVDADVELDEKGEVKSVTVNNGLGAKVGNNLDLPADFPKDVHVSGDWSVMAISPAPQGGFMLNATTTSSVDDTLSAIREKMAANGWSVENEDQPNAMMNRIGFVKDDRLASFNLINTGAQLNVQLVTMKRPS